MSNPVVTIEMESGAVMTGELYPELAPNTVNNFIELANSGFYDGLIFHRVIPGFMIQGGDPNGTGMGGPGWRIKGEFARNGVANPLRHERGVLSMARSMHPDSAGSQFFIMVEAAPHLDGSYAAFGRVLEGMEAADRVVNAPTGPNDRPREPQAIRSIRVETFGEEYPGQQAVNGCEGALWKRQRRPSTSADGIIPWWAWNPRSISGGWRCMWTEKWRS